MGRVTIYTTTGCVDCARAKRILDRHKTRFVEINLTLHPFRLDEMRRFTGMRTVPRILFNTSYIGGVEELEALAEGKKLHEMIKELEKIECESFLPPVPEGAEPRPSPHRKMMISLEKRNVDQVFQKIYDKDHGVIKKKKYRGNLLGNGLPSFKGSDLLQTLQSLKFSQEEAEDMATKLHEEGYIMHLKSKKKDFSDSALYYFFADVDTGILNARRKWNGLGRNVQIFAHELQMMLLRLCDKFVSSDGKEVDYDSIKGSDEFSQLNTLSLELQEVDLTDLESKDLLAFFLNVHNMLVLHINVINGRPSTREQCDRLFSRFSYIISKYKFTAEDIHHGVLRGNEKPHGKFRAPFSKDDPRRAIIERLKSVKDFSRYLSPRADVMLSSASPLPSMTLSSALPSSLLLSSSIAAISSLGGGGGGASTTKISPLSSSNESIQSVYIGDPRFHMALHTSDRSSPPVRIYGGDVLADSLNWATEGYCSDMVSFDLEQRLVILPSVFQFYPQDFGDSTIMILRWISKYVEPEKNAFIQQLVASGKFEVRYHQEQAAVGTTVMQSGTDATLTDDYSNPTSRKVGAYVVDKIRLCRQRSDESLEITNGQLKEVPTALCSLNLRHLDISRNTISFLPQEFGGFVNLEKLSLIDNRLSELPKEFSQLQNLTSLDISSNDFCCVPEILTSLSTLKSFSCCHNSITSILDSFCILTSLQSLLISDNILASLPDRLSELSRLMILDISSNQLTKFPLLPASLEELFLHRNCLHSIGENAFTNLSRLELLDLSSNGISELPVSVSLLTNLNHLNMSQNRIKQVGAIVSLLPSLSFIDIKGNPIIDVPTDLSYSSTNLLSLLKAKKQMPRPLTRGSSICDIILAGSPSLGQLNSNLLGSSIPRSPTKSTRGSPSLGPMDAETHTITSRPSATVLTEQASSSNSKPKRKSSDANTPTELSSSVATTLGVAAAGPDGRLISLSPRSLSTSPRVLLRKTGEAINAKDILATIPLITPSEHYLIEDGVQEKLRSKRLHSITSLLCDESNEYVMAHSNGYYQNIFLGRSHSNFLGFDEGYGFVCVSVLHDPEKGQELLNNKIGYRALIRTQNGDKMVILSESDNKKVSRRKFSKSMQKILQLLLNIRDFVEVTNEEGIAEQLVELEEKLTIMNHKVAVLYTKENQMEEEQFYGNEHGSSDFEEFLSILGDRIALKDWDKFAGGLDTSGDRMGKESIFLEYGSAQIMYHISTFLPHKPLDPQQIERKCHLGNDVVMIIFQDGTTPFCPDSIASQFNTFFIVIRKEPFKEKKLYRVNIAQRTEIGYTEPVLQNPPVFDALSLRPFLIEKILTGEQSSWARMPTFSGAIKRARKIYLEELYNTHARKKN